MNSRIVSTARIAMRLAGGSKLFLFVRSGEPGWDQWWTSLFERLLLLAEPRPAWEFEPEQGIFYARRDLDAAENKDIASWLGAAPATELASHRTLRKMVDRLATADQELELAFFSKPTPEDQL
jgi:hypothetical protein